LDFYTASDPLVEVFFWIGVVSLAVTMFMTMQIVVLRLLYARRQRRAQALRVHWRAELRRVLQGGQGVSPPARGVGLTVLLELWNKWFEAMNDEACRARLIAFARAHGLASIMRARLASRDLRVRLRAVRSVGNMRLAEAWPALAAMVEQQDTVLSLSAMESLVRLDAQRAIAPLLRALIRHRDWPRDRVAGLFQEIGADLLSKPLAAWMCTLPDAEMARLVRYLELIHERDALMVVRRRLQDGGEECVAGCIYILGRIPTHASLRLVRRYCTHASWIVRNQVAIALGRIGDRQDVARLLALAGDANRWVRMRAAQALVALPGVSADEVRRWAEQASDRFAHDALVQALAESSVRA